MATFLGPQALTRMHRELRMLETEPPPGVSAWPKDENKIHEVSGREPTALAALSPLSLTSPVLTTLPTSLAAQLEAVIQGPPDTVYEEGSFRLNVTVPSR